MPRPTCGRLLDDPVWPEPENVILLCRDEVVDASLDAVEVSTTRMVTASPIRDAF